MGGPPVSDCAAQSAQLTGGNGSARPLGPTGSDTWVGPKPAISVAVLEGFQRLDFKVVTCRSWPEYAHRESPAPWVGSFKRASDVALFGVGGSG